MDYGPRVSTGGGAADRPLLGVSTGSGGSPHHSAPSSPRRAHPPSFRGPAGVSFSRLRRWWKPFLILLVPPLLIYSYALVHPLFPDTLPALPKVKIETQHGSWSSSSDAATGDDNATGDKETIYVTPGSCICPDTERGQQLCNVYQRQGLQTSRLYEGSGARVRRLLANAREGKAVKVGVLGGSVSACRGVHPSPEFPEGDPSGPGCYTSLVKHWFQDAFPTTNIEFKNGAIGGSDSSYYAFCGTHHIATDVDLVILEFDVNDQSDPVYQTFFDQLLRVLLEFESQPAIVILGSWSPQVAQDQGYGDPQIVHLPIAHYYDIPYVSLKRLIFNHYTRYPQSTAKTFFLADQLHPNARGHRLLSDILVSYLESQLCLLDHYGLPVVPPIEHTIATSDPSSSLIDVNFDMPQPLRVDGAVDWTKPPDGWEETFNEDNLEAIGNERRLFALPQTPYAIPFFPMFAPLVESIDPNKPDPSSPSHILDLRQPELFCADANDAKNPMQPTSHEGWEPFVWNGEKHYWVSSEVDARIRVEVKVNAGRIAVYYFRSQHYDLGDALCWVDDNEKGAIRLSGYWTKQYNMAVVDYIDRNVTSGDHYVTCKIAEENSHPHNPDAHHFRIVAVMAT